MTQLVDPTPALEALKAATIPCADAAVCASLLGEARRVRGWLDSIEARITSRQRELASTAGAAPAAALHTTCGGVSAAEGRRKERRSEALDSAPAFGDALATGAIGAEHVDALANVTARLDDEIRAELFGRADELLADAERSTPEAFGRTCREMARLLERDNGLSRNERQRRETFLSRRVDHRTGMVEGRFAFHPELANQVFGTVDREVASMISEGTARGDREFVERTVDRNRLAAEALGRLVANGHHHVRPLEADITLVVDAMTAATGELHDHSICETGDGLELPPESIARLLCQGRITPIYVDADGTALDAGRTVRHANRKQRRALRAMYRTCAFHGCDAAFDRCEIHHIEPWELGGATDLLNLVPMCSHHHHVVHELGWRLTLDPGDRTLTIRQPDGSVFAGSRPDVAERTRRRRQPAA